MRIFGTQEKGKIRTTPSFALAMLIVNFVGVVRGFRGPTPHIAQYPFEIVSQRGVSHKFAFCFHRVSRKYR